MTTFNKSLTFSSMIGVMRRRILKVLFIAIALTSFYCSMNNASSIVASLQQSSKFAATTTSGSTAAIQNEKEWSSRNAAEIEARRASERSRFKVPTDIENQWVPVSAKEQAAYSVAKPECQSRTGFEYCCLGQCHQKHFFHPNPKALLYKWVAEGGRELANMEELLRETRLELMADRFDNHASCNFVFIGDSLAGDHALSAMCQTSLMKDSDGNYVYEKTSQSCRPFFGLGAYGNGTCADDPDQQKYNENYVEFERINNDEGLCKRVIFIQIGLWDPRRNELVADVPFYMDQLHQLPTDIGIMLWNWGVHCNDRHDGCVSHVMKNSLLRFVKDPRFSQWKMMWRETEPQHFNSPDGQYQPDAPLECAAVSRPDPWRNHEAKQFLARHGLEKRVAWVPIFDRLAIPFVHTFHYPTDCTHYCYAPWRLHLTWDGMVHGLRFFRLQENLER